MAKDSEGTKQSTNTSCRCGRGKNASNKEKLNCSKSSVYSSRCPCLRNNDPCTSKCSCKCCDNHFGKADQEPITVITARRKRPRHKEQKLARSAGVKFMKSMDEQPSAGKWTPIEHYVLLGILHYQTGQNNVTSDLIKHTNKTSELYSAIVQIVVHNGICISHIKIFCTDMC